MGSLAVVGVVVVLVLFDFWLRLAFVVAMPRRGGGPLLLALAASGQSMTRSALPQGRRVQRWCGPWPPGSAAGAGAVARSRSWRRGWAPGDLLGLGPVRPAACLGACWAGGRGWGLLGVPARAPGPRGLARCLLEAGWGYRFLLHTLVRPAPGLLDDRCRSPRDAGGSDGVRGAAAVGSGLGRLRECGRLTAPSRSGEAPECGEEQPVTHCRGA